MKILLAHAIKEERIDINIPDAEVVYVETGVAKARAALRLMHAICEMNIPFVAVKYITDVVGKNSVEAWLDKLADARKTLTEFFR